MTNPSLAELQHALQEYLLEQNSSIAAITLETEKFPRLTRLEIYHHAYQMRLIAALEHDYPKLLLLLGKTEFSEMAAEYIKQHPSRQPSLRWLGEKLPLFLQGHPHYGPTWLWELAAFEWAQITAFDAQDAQPATLENLRALDHQQWPNMRLQLQPALQLISFHSNAPELWQSLNSSQSPIAITILDRAQDWLLWRDDLQVLFRPLDPAEAGCLQAFLRNENFTQVCTGLCQWFSDDQVPIKAVEFLQQWLQSQLICAISTE